MRKYGVIGYPLGHTFSPQIHNPAFKALGIEATYEVYQIQPDKFNETVTGLKAGQCSGFNVTVPYKQKVIPFIDEIDPVAQRVNAVNTIKKADGKWYGYNTDLFGFLFPIENYLKNIKSVLIIGAGGAANAVCFALLDSANIKHMTIANRTIENANALKNSLDKTYNTEIETTSLEHESDKKYELVVNTTSVGMGQTQNQNPYNLLNSYTDKTVVYDLIYNPEKTELLKQAELFKLKAINGLDMLIAQAAKSFFIWTGKEFPNHVIDKRIFYK